MKYNVKLDELNDVQKKCYALEQALWKDYLVDADIFCEDIINTINKIKQVIKDERTRHTPNSN